MSDSQFYWVRIRGKVQGPLTADAVCQGVRAGRIGSMHEVSADRRRWQPLRSCQEIMSLLSPPAEVERPGRVETAPSEEPEEPLLQHMPPPLPSQHLTVPASPWTDVPSSTAPVMIQFEQPPMAFGTQTHERASHPSEAGGRTCSILSICCGGVAFLFCPVAFGPAGVVLGIIGICLSRQKALGIIGVVLSIVGTIVGMIIGMMVGEMMDMDYDTW
jgi:hypothetical protein